jgi:hypothetical protein
VRDISDTEALIIVTAVPQAGVLLSVATVPRPAVNGASWRARTTSARRRRGWPRCRGFRLRTSTRFIPTRRCCRRSERSSPAPATRDRLAFVKSVRDGAAASARVAIAAGTFGVTGCEM